MLPNDENVYLCSYIRRNASTLCARGWGPPKGKPTHTSRPSQRLPQHFLRVTTSLFIQVKQESKLDTFWNPIRHPETANLKVRPDPLERGRDNLSIKYSWTSNGLRMWKLCAFEVDAISGGRIGFQKMSNHICYACCSNYKSPYTSLKLSGELVFRSAFLLYELYDAT